MFHVSSFCSSDVMLSPGDLAPGPRFFVALNLCQAISDRNMVGQECGSVSSLQLLEKADFCEVGKIRRDTFQENNYCWSIPQFRQPHRWLDDSSDPTQGAWIEFGNLSCCPSNNGNPSPPGTIEQMPIMVRLEHPNVEHCNDPNYFEIDRSRTDDFNTMFNCSLSKKESFEIVVLTSRMCPNYLDYVLNVSRTELDCNQDKTSKLLICTVIPGITHGTATSDYICSRDHLEVTVIGTNSSDVTRSPLAEMTAQSSDRCRFSVPLEDLKAVVVTYAFPRFAAIANISGSPFEMPVDNSQSDSNTVPIIAGGAAGGVLLLCIVAFAICVSWRRGRYTPNKDDQGTDGSDERLTGNDATRNSTGHGNAGHDPCQSEGVIWGEQPADQHPSSGVAMLQRPSCEKDEDRQPDDAVHQRLLGGTGQLPPHETNGSSATESVGEPKDDEETGKQSDRSPCVDIEGHKNETDSVGNSCDATITRDDTARCLQLRKEYCDQSDGNPETSSGKTRMHGFKMSQFSEILVKGPLVSDLYDICVIRRQGDKEWVERNLTPQFRELNLSIFDVQGTQRAEDLGQLVSDFIVRNIECSSCFVIICSSDSMDFSFKYSLELALQETIKGRNTEKLLIISVDGAPRSVEDSLVCFTRIDWSDIDQRQLVVKKLQSVADNRVR